MVWLWNTIRWSLKKKKLKHTMITCPAIPVLGIQPKELKGGVQITYPRTFIALLVTIARDWKQLKYLPTVVYPCKEYHSATKKKISLVAQMVKSLPAMQETQVQCQGQEDPLEKEMATHPSILACRIPWTEEAGGLQPLGSQRVGQD